MARKFYLSLNKYNAHKQTQHITSSIYVTVNLEINSRTVKSTIEIDKTMAKNTEY